MPLSTDLALHSIHYQVLFRVLLKVCHKHSKSKDYLFAKIDHYQNIFWGNAAVFTYATFSTPISNIQTIGFRLRVLTIDMIHVSFLLVNLRMIYGPH